MAARGWAAPELGRACARALELCRQMGETPQTFTALGIASALPYDAGRAPDSPRAGRASSSIWLSAAKILSK